MGGEKMLTGAEIIIECLKEQGVDTVFGYPGGTVLSVYDALYRNKDSIRHILTSHEQGAAHAADGYARATGKTGVCLVTSGPGATNIVTGIATAYMDSTPLVAITINVPLDHLGKDSFQEVDIAGITMPITKYNFIVKDINKLADTIRRAFDIASSGRKGPVLIDITRDVTNAAAVMGEAENKQNIPKKKEYFDRKIIEKEVGEAVKLMKKAKRPVLLAGGGCVHSRAQKELIALEEKYNMPVVDTLMGKGAFPGSRAEYLGMVGIHGTAAANYAVAHADLLLAVGCRFSDRVAVKLEECVQNAVIIQIDIDKAELNKNFRVDVGINSDAKAALSLLEKKLPQKSFNNWTDEVLRVRMASEDISGFMNNRENDLIREQKNSNLKTEIITGQNDRSWGEDKKSGQNNHEIVINSGEKSSERENSTITGQDSSGEQNIMNGPEIVRHIYKVTEGRAIITTEVGQNQMLAATYYSYSTEGQLITSGGLGTMGFGLGAAIGAGLGRPDKKVVNIAGDGCFRMNMNELMTAVRYGVPVVEVIIDNNSLGMVHQMQAQSFDGRYSETEFFDSPDFAGIAVAMGAMAKEPLNYDELDKALKEALDEKEAPTVIICRVSKNETV